MNQNKENKQGKRLAQVRALIRRKFETPARSREARQCPSSEVIPVDALRTSPGDWQQGDE